MNPRRRITLTVVLAFVFLVGLFVFGVSGGVQFSTPCTPDLLVVETPEGWDLRRDHFNGCDWTLFNASGDRAPRELYEGVQVDYPGSPVFYPLRLLGIAFILTPLTVGESYLVGRFRTREPRQPARRL